jgi:L-threonylcarbamoyladenylate synthase
MINPEFKEDIEWSVQVLRMGGTILYPTDTIWGIGCDATNPKAVAKVYALKQRTESKSLIILLDTFEKIADYIEKVPDIAYDLFLNMDNPVTIIYSGARNLAHNVVAEDGTIAIRIVKDEFCKQLIARFGKPIVSSSANVSGLETPLFYNNIAKEIISGVNYTVTINHQKITGTKPSTIIRLYENGEFLIIRP